MGLGFGVVLEAWLAGLAWARGERLVLDWGLVPEVVLQDGTGGSFTRLGGSLLSVAATFSGEAILAAAAPPAPSPLSGGGGPSGKTLL